MQLLWQSMEENLAFKRELVSRHTEPLCREFDSHPRLDNQPRYFWDIPELSCLCQQHSSVLHGKDLQGSNQQISGGSSFLPECSSTTGCSKNWAAPPTLPSNPTKESRRANGGGGVFLKGVGRKSWWMMSLRTERLPTEGGTTWCDSRSLWEQIGLLRQLCYHIYGCALLQPSLAVSAIIMLSCQ